MFEYLSGKPAESSPSYVVIDCNGIGYLVQISLNTYSAIRGKESVKLLIHYSVSVDVRSGESKHTLFGFATGGERDLFRLLCSVSGISSGLARNILSTLTTEQAYRAIATGDDKTLSSVKGVGPKTALKAVAELRGKLNLSLENRPNLSLPENNKRNDALMALSSLGMDRIKAEKILDQIISISGPDTPLEEIIRQTLRQL